VDPLQTEATERGRKAFLRGVELTRQEQWGDALTAFQEAAAARDAPRVEFNIAYCLRALGRYVAARKVLKRVLSNPTGLDPSQVDDAKAYLADSGKLVARAQVTLDPPTAIVTIDGRALEADTGTEDTFEASSESVEDSRSIGKASFVVLLDPGMHIFRAVREGRLDAVVQRAVRSGEVAAVDMRLDLLPATISVRSNPSDGIVRVDGREVGIAPIEFARAAGTYKLDVVHDNFETYEVTLHLQPGERSDLTAKLAPHSVPLTRRWWFWTGAVAIVAGGVVLTYALTRPAPTSPPYDAGSANWLVHAQSRTLLFAF
jgi:PEGA domain-containing protein